MTQRPTPSPVARQTDAAPEGALPTLGCLSRTLRLSDSFIARLVGVSPSALCEARAHGGALALDLEDPTVTAIVRLCRELVAIFPTDTERWHWFFSPVADQHGMTPFGLVRQGRTPEALALLAAEADTPPVQVRAPSNDMRPDTR